MKHTLKHFETGEVIVLSLPEILEEINRDRSEQWQDYDETDWQEGLETFTEWRLVP